MDLVMTPRSFRGTLLADIILGAYCKQYIPTVIELRASMIVGDGSIAYEIMKRLVHTLPIQTMPAWAVTMTQPITLDDAIKYLTASLTVRIKSHQVIEIGGPEQLSYRDLVKKYAVYTGKKPVLILVPILPLWVGALWLNLFTPRRHAKVGKEIVESLRNPMVVTNNKALEIFPDIKPRPIEQGFTRPD